ncbi:MAG TPA: YdcF family protein [Trichocoleus sp.]
MIDPSFCRETVESSWVPIKHTIFRWVTQPALVLPVLLALTSLPWVLRAERWKRSATCLGAVLVVMYLSMFSPTIAKIGNRFLMVGVPQDSGQSTDAIVVLGRGATLGPSRVDVAARLWQQQRAPVIFASGRVDAPVIVQALEEKGVPAQALDGEPCSSTTEENAEFTAALLRPQGVQRILLVTDPPHMLRSLLTFQSYGFEVVPHPSPLPGSPEAPSYRKLLIREWAGLIAYGLMGRYFARPASPEVPWASQPAEPTPLETPKTA